MSSDYEEDVFANPKQKEVYEIYKKICNDNGVSVTRPIRSHVDGMPIWSIRAPKDMTEEELKTILDSTRTRCKEVFGDRL